MTIIILGGNSPSNKQRAESVQKKLEEMQYMSHIHYYTHREKGGVINIHDESNKLRDKIHTRKDKQYSIIAKSAGTLVYFHLSQLITPQYVLLCGIPLTFSRQINNPLPSSLPSLGKIGIFQNSNDPEGKYKNIVQMYGKSCQFLYYEENSTHHYDPILVVHTFSLLKGQSLGEIQ